MNKKQICSGDDNTIIKRESFKNLCIIEILYCICSRAALNKTLSNSFAKNKRPH